MPGGNLNKEIFLNTVKSDVEGGTLVIKDKTYPIEAGKPLTVPYEK